MPQSITIERISERSAELCVRLIHQDRTNVHAAIADDAAVVTKQLRLVVADHHGFGNELKFAVAVIAFRFLPDLERGQ